LALTHIKSARLRLVAILLGGCFALLAGRLFVVQVVQHEKYRKLANAQHYFTMELPAPRGCILSSDGVELALPVPVKSIHADPKFIEDPVAAAEGLSRVTGVSKAALLERLARQNRFVWIKRRVTDEEADAALALGITGVDTREEFQRFYPYNELLGQVLGYMNMDDVGAAGIEQTLDTTLAGKPGERMMARAAGGRVICVPGLPVKDPVPGRNVVLTINSVVQHIVEQELADAALKWRADRGMAVMMDPTDGSLLAIATWPTFDPNKYSKYPPKVRKRLEKNAAGVDLYEPGSAFKPFIAAHVLDQGLANENTVFNCEHGCAVLNGRRLHDVHPYGSLTLAEIIIKSSNIGAAKLGLLLGPQRLRDGVAKFGFGSKPDLPFPGICAGTLRPLHQWTSYSISSVPIGQEVSVTAVQLCSGFATIVNDGRRMRVRLVKQIIDPETGAIEEQDPQELDQVIRPETAKKLRDILVGVVEEGTAKAARIDAYQIGGKTGTAQLCLPGGKGYAPGRYNSTFVGFGPADQPRVVALVTLDSPKEAHYGGTVSSPAVAKILQRTLAYYGVPPRPRPADRVAQAPGRTEAD
jgi:cell division protein FtsI/penicillin-binding protein 2